MIFSISPLTVAFCISGVLRVWRSVSWKVDPSGSFGVRIVSVPAEAIECVDAALFFHIRQIP